jgi:hypothetical protein
MCSDMKNNSEKNYLENKTIPKKVFHTWENKDLPPALECAVKSWKTLNPDWQVELFDATDRRSFVAKHFSSDVLWAYDQLIPGAYKADLWRYCVLYIEGGVYADIKFSLLFPLEEVISPDATLVTVIDKGAPSLCGASEDCNPYLAQGFLACAPNSLVMRKAIDEIVKHVKCGDYTADYLSITGPGLLGRVVNRLMSRDETTSYVAGCYQVGDEVYRLLPVWNIKKRLFFNAEKRPFMNRSSAGYRKALGYKGKVKVNHDFDVIKGQYARCWFLSMVYLHGKDVFPAMNEQQKIAFNKGRKRAHLQLIKCLYRANAKTRARNWLKLYLKEYGCNFKFIFEILKYEIVLGRIFFSEK